MPIMYDDSRIKRPGALTSFTAPMVCEMKKAIKSVVYFAENFYYIVHPINGKQKIELYDFQKNVLEHYQNNRFSIVLASRQVGKCVGKDTMMRLRNKKTGEIQEISAEDFYQLIKSK